MLRRDRLHRFRLFLHAGARAVELKNSVGAGLYPSSFEYLMQTSICTSSSDSILATGIPTCIATITVSTAELEIRKLAYRRADGFRDSIKPQLDLGDDAERAFRTDEEPGEIVAGARLARTAARS